MKVKLRKPKESFVDYWNRKRTEEYHKDMGYIYAIGAVAIHHERIPIKRRHQIARIIEEKIDKRQMAYNRRYKREDGTWVWSPHDWDQRNWRWYFNLRKELKSRWKLNFKKYENKH